MKKNDMVLPICLSIFAVIGIGLIVASICLFANGLLFRQSAVEITGTIEDITYYYDSDDEIHHQVFVTYAFEGKNYEGVRLNEYDGSMYVGKEIPLLCDPENPRKIETTSGFYWASITLFVMGIVCAGIGIIPLVVLLKKSLQAKRLLAKGYVLYATVEKVTINTSLTVNGQNPYVIYCTWQNEYTGALYRFKSKNLWVEPAFDTGSEIKVYVDENDYSKYYVDTEQAEYQQIYDYT
ncbi:MAG: hypothetical protein HDR01_15715 [Lachnospiraceae bacterium]|nr:hypothetical protein [Lachnospiraceae bacterium]